MRAAAMLSSQNPRAPLLGCHQRAVCNFRLHSWKHGFDPRWFLPPFRNKLIFNSDLGKQIAMVKLMETDDNRHEVTEVLNCCVITSVLNIDPASLANVISLTTAMFDRPELMAAIDKDLLRLSASASPKTMMFWAWAPVFGLGPWIKPGEISSYVAEMHKGFFPAFGPAEFLFGPRVLKTDYGPCFGTISIGYLYPFFN